MSAGREEKQSFSVVISNEFAVVLVEVDNAPNSPVLRLTDTESGLAAVLDALELQRIVHIAPDGVVPYPHGWAPDLAPDIDKGGLSSE